MRRLTLAVFSAGFLLVALLSAAAQEKAAAPVTAVTGPLKVTHVLGFQDIRRTAAGTLDADASGLHWVSKGTKADVPLAQIQDVFTADDSRRALRGTVGTISMFAPYESGRFLSLFRTKIDVLTLQYKDEKGGVHGAIFEVPQGQAAGLKKKLVDLGVHTSVPVEEPKAPAATEEKKS